MEINGIYCFGEITLTSKTPIKILKNTFLVPDYYPDFSCKGGNCRHTCCNGWEVTIPMNQYFYLVGLQCSQSLRSVLDRTFRILDHPSKERYAEIAHNHQGSCPLLQKNGYCALHEKYGEEVLPSVCRYYPRGPRYFYAYESSCANSCERTLELLFQNDNPVKFIEMPLIFKLTTDEKVALPKEQALYQSIRKNCFDILQNRQDTLPNRIMKIGRLLMALDSNPEITLSQTNITVSNYNPTIEKSISLLHQISSWLIETDSSIALYCQTIQDNYQNQDTISYYQQALKHFEEVVPNHEILFEKMMINDLYFRQFPFQEHTMSFYDEFISICGLYSFIRYISIHTMINFNTVEDYIDILAKTFRVIAHTKFGKNIMNQMKRYQLVDYDKLGVFIQL